MAITILKGTIISAPAPGRLDITENGYLVAEDGRLTGVFPTLPVSAVRACVRKYGPGWGPYTTGRSFGESGPLWAKWRRRGGPHALTNNREKTPPCGGEK